jgi:hypothetical protein
MVYLLRLGFCFALAMAERGVPLREEALLPLRCFDDFEGRLVPEPRAMSVPTVSLVAF